MSVFKKPIHMPDPSFEEIYTGFVEFYDDIEHCELNLGEMRTFKVKNGAVNGDVEADIAPVVSVLWKTKRLDGGVKYESKFVARRGHLITISCDVYGNNSKMLNILYNTGWPGFTWLAHTITFIKVDSVVGNKVTFTCYKVN